MGKSRLASTLRASIPLTSPPAQNARPAPVRMIASISSSLARSRKSVSKSVPMSSLTALSELGRLSVTVATRLSFSTMTALYLL
jgi:hypothetical protein